VRSGSASAAITAQARFIANRAQLVTTHLMPTTLPLAALLDDTQSRQIAAIVRATVPQPL